MVESFVTNATEHRITVPDGYVVDRATMTLRPVETHPSMETLRRGGQARRQRLGACADILMGMGV